MADEIIIGNVGGDGVASEATLAALVRAVEKMGQARGQKGTGDKTQALANKAIASGTTATTANTKTVTANTGELNKSAAALGKFTNSLTNMAMAGIGTAMASIGAMAGELYNGSNNVADFAQHIPVVGSLFAALGKYLDDSMSSFKKLSMSGASFNNDLTELRRTSADLSLNLDEFTGLVGRNTEKFAAIGGTATQGVQKIAQMNKALGEQREQLMAMGFSAEDVVEALTDYAYLSRAGSRAEKLSIQQQAEQATAAASYAKNLQTLSKMTGQDVKSMQDKLAAQSADIAFQMKMNKLAPAEREKAKQAMADALAMGGETGVEYFKQQFLGLPPLTERTQLFAATMGQSAAVIAGMNRDVQNTGISLQQFNAGGVDRFADFVEGAANAGQSLESILAASAGGLEGPGKELAGILQGMGKQFTDYVKTVDGRQVFDKEALKRDLQKAKTEQAASAASTDAMAKFETSMRNARAALQKAFIDSGILDLVVKGITWFAENVGTIANEIVTLITKIKEGDIWGAIKSLFNGTGAIAAVVGGITALFLGKAALGAMASAIGGLAGKLSSSLTNKIGGVFGSKTAGPVSQAAGPLAGAGPAKGSSAGKGFGQAMGNIGKGLGQGIGGVLKGLAAGLKAFANPAILIGAGILGGAIVAIGAGIAGAAWILGKALPTFAEGLKSFADIDGNNLLNVAKGIAGVGAALAVFGVGAVVGAVGSVIANIIDLLPGKGPLEKLKEFADVDLNTQRIINNANAMVAYSNAMKGFSGGPAPSILAAFKTGIVSLLGGETDPMAPIKKFGELSLNTSGIIANAKAVSAYATAMKDFPQSPSASVFTSLKDGIISLLGGSTDVLAPIKTFGEIKFNTSGIIANAEAVSAYATAMKDFPQSPSASVFTSLKDGIIGLLGGSTDVLAPIKAFGEVSLNTAVIKSNAEAVSAYATAMKDFPSSPSASVFTSLKDGIISLLGGSTDVLAPIKAFGEVSLNTAVIKSNAEAVLAYGEAIKNFPQSPSASVFTSLKDGIIGLLGGSTDVLAPIKAFNNITLDPAKIKLNAEAMAAFGDALSKVPEVKSERTGGLMGAISSFFGGDQVMPWDRLREFGDAKINAEKVVKNAQALSSFGNALKAFQGGSEATSNISISDSLIKNLGRLSTINADGLVSTAAGLQSIADVRNLAPILTSLNSLDATKLVSYNTALKDLTKTLEALNKELAKENKGGMFGMGDSKANAGDLLKNISLNTSQGAGNSEQLSGIMSQVLEVLKQMKEVDDKIEKNTKGFGSDISVRDVTSM